MTETSGWPDGATLALSLVVNVEEGSEMSLADGDPGPDAVDELGVALRKPVRNFGNESNYRYGLKAGAPRILALLRRYGVPATFTAAALSLERAPDLARRIVADGHEVCSHGWRWVHQYRMEEDEERAFIRRAVDSIEQTTGQRPRGWLSRYLFTPNTRRLLVEAGFAYHMDDYSDDVPFWDHADGRPILGYRCFVRSLPFYTGRNMLLADFYKPDVTHERDLSAVAIDGPVALCSVLERGPVAIVCRTRQVGDLESTVGPLVHVAEIGTYSILSNAHVP